MAEPQYRLEGIVRTKSELMEDFEGPLDVIFLLLSKNKIEIQDIPIALILEQYLEYLGYRHSQRISTLVTDLIVHSEGQDKIIMSEEALYHMNGLRKFMFENVYRSKKVKQDEELDKIRNMLFFLYDYFLKNPEKLPKERLEMVDEWGLEEVVKDQIAGMTDRYAVNMFSEIFIPKGWR